MGAQEKIVLLQKGTLQEIVPITGVHREYGYIKIERPTGWEEYDENDKIENEGKNESKNG